MGYNRVAIQWKQVPVEIIHVLNIYMYPVSSYDVMWGVAFKFVVY